MHTHASPRSSPKPFLLALVPPLAEATHDEAVRAMREVEASYDPESQTSNVPLYAGTQRTYVTTGTGLLGVVDSDSKASDG